MSVLSEEQKEGYINNTTHMLMLCQEVLQGLLKNKPGSMQNSNHAIAVALCAVAMTLGTLAQATIVQMDATKLFVPRGN